METRYTRGVRALLRRHRIFFLLLAAAGLALRVAFFWKLRFVEGDSLIYGDYAKNLLLHHTLGFSDDGGVTPSLIRLPGYPAFLALIWMFTGVEHYYAVMFVQIAADLGTCFVAAALALELLGGLAGDRAALWAFALAALCPFLANATVTPLTETLAIFFTALTFYCAARASREGDALRWWAGCGAAVAASILLRPDGGLLLAALGIYFAVRLWRSTNKRRVFLAGALVTAIALAPLVPWTLRNWRVFHVFQPLAPRYANDPGEFVAYGYQLWTKTWIVDYVSVEDFYWPIPGDDVDAGKLPARACDSEAQCRRTRALLSEYNQAHRITPELDARFAELARERIADHWFRQNAVLPVMRAADMWLRPRTEMLPLDNHWWDYESDPRDSLIGIALGLLNLLYLACAVMGIATRRVRLLGLMLLWMLLRTVLLGTLAGAESRYTLECFPLVFVFAAAWLAGLRPAPVPRPMPAR